LGNKNISILEQNILQKGNKASVKEQIESKRGTKIYEPWNKKRKKASSKEQIESKRGIKI
jgi:hypothetical protein